MKTQKQALKTEWNLALLYKNPKDPQIEKDTVLLEASYADFAKKYKDAESYTKDEKALLAVLIDWEKLAEQAGSWKPGIYFSYIKALKSDDTYSEAQLNLLTSRLTKAGNSVLFFPLRLGKIEKSLQDCFLKNPTLSKYHYFLKHLWEGSRHDLSEAEEKIMNYKSLPAHALWVSGQEKLLNSQTILYKGKKLPIAEALSKMASLPMEERRMLWAEIRKTLKSISHFAEAEINAIYTDKKIDDELRGFKEPYSATILGYQNEEKTINTLVETVTEHFHISQRFYKLKAKLLGLKKLTSADRNASIGEVKKKILFPQALEIVSSSFGKVDKKYADILNSFVQNGQIDVFPKKGKEGGAFCSSSTNNPTFVLLNHVDTLNCLTTFGHEMGHAIHSELSDSQPVIYQGYSYAVAETASTLFENFVFDEVFESLSEKEKIIALHDRINGAIATVFRQIACFNFELALHNEIRKKGAVSGEEIALLLNKHMGAYCGPALEISPDDGYFFVTWSHIRRFFYVYSYAFGFLVSQALYAEYKKDKKNLAKIEKFLSAGSSKSPEDIFKDVGIDVTNPSFFIDGLKNIESDITLLESLTKNFKK